MSADELKALEALTFNYTRGREDVWSPSPYHIEGLHGEAAGVLRRGIEEARASEAASPLGIVIRGQRGVGKTHLLGWTRQQVQQQGGFFFLVNIHSGRTFWHEVLAAIVERVQPRSHRDRGQLGVLLDDLTDRADLPDAVRGAITGRASPSWADVDSFVKALWRLDRAVGLDCQDTARALVLLASPAYQHESIGSAFLYGQELDVTERREWGFRARQKQPQTLITELSRILALAGPIVLAIDQIDALIDEIDRAGAAGAAESEDKIHQVASGLMALRDMTHRTLTVVACLQESWTFIRKHAVDTVTDRFRPPLQLRNIPNAEVGRTLVEKRFAVEFASVGFEPPYPTWPVKPGAFQDADGHTARSMLTLIGTHVSSCLRDRVVRELSRLDDAADAVATDEPAAQGVPPVIPTLDSEELAGLDARFQRLRMAAEVNVSPFTSEGEDSKMPVLLAAGLEAWIREQGAAETGQPFSLDPPPGRNPALHARLRMTIDEHTERQQEWAFRAISANSARAFLSRLRKAIDMAGFDGHSTDRRLFVLRNTDWPTGPTTNREKAAFVAKGGISLPITEDDLRTFAALGTLLAEGDHRLDGWLVARRHAHGTELLGHALGEVPRPPPVQHPSTETGRVRDSRLFIGTALTDGTPESLELDSLRRHTVIFAGSGSGKTVLVRRIVEECALRGVSAIVLDPNNDLARLGDAWPDPPDTWTDGDAERAHEYLASTDVVVWTPLRQSGRPLAFRPLPGFADVLDNNDEFNATVGAAVETLAPRVGLNRNTTKAQKEKAVLIEALTYFARTGGGGLRDFISLLATLPDGAGTIGRAPAIAADLAERLGAATIIDPLFGGTGQSADPAVLLTPSPGKRARVSVISLIGLPEQEQQQSFVSQLQMALFSWVKKHPAPDERPSALFVMDEAQTFAPSQGATVSTHSTVVLVRQARKYGLGLVFATQAPRGLHNQVSGNATTQFVGRLNHQTQIETARNLARAKGGDLPGIANLTAGQFYFAPEDRGFRTVRVPMCLSHHPPSPLTEEEVLGRARGL